MMLSILIPTPHPLSDFALCRSTCAYSRVVMAEVGSFLIFFFVYFFPCQFDLSPTLSSPVSDFSRMFVGGFPQRLFVCLFCMFWCRRRPAWCGPSLRVIGLPVLEFARLTPRRLLTSSSQTSPAGPWRCVTVSAFCIWERVHGTRLLFVFVSRFLFLLFFSGASGNV